MSKFIFTEIFPYILIKFHFPPLNLHISSVCSPPSPSIFSRIKFRRKALLNLLVKNMLNPHFTCKFSFLTNLNIPASYTVMYIKISSKGGGGEGRIDQKYQSIDQYRKRKIFIYPSLLECSNEKMQISQDSINISRYIKIVNVERERVPMFLVFSLRRSFLLTVQHSFLLFLINEMAIIRGKKGSSIGRVARTNWLEMLIR